MSSSSSNTKMFGNWMQKAEEFKKRAKEKVDLMKDKIEEQKRDSTSPFGKLANRMNQQSSNSSGSSNNNNGNNRNVTAANASSKNSQQQRKMPPRFSNNNKFAHSAAYQILSLEFL